MRHLILGTAGHIDHGKTALVRALTGVDTDRLPEEKRRGITIDLGFARLDLHDGPSLGIIDVPGHEAFVRNMLAGATGMDLVLLVVAADEGVMPQTREHLAIVELLGIRRGVVALTKSDLVDPEWVELAVDDVRQLIARTALQDAPVVPVSARTGAGLEALKAALTAAAVAVADRDCDDLFRMPVDRVFTVRGTGTVVTGTVWSGALRRDAQVRIEPAGLSARVRGLQRHGADADEVRAGERAAIALAGVDRHALGRGETLVTSPAWRTSDVLTVELGVLGDAGGPIRPRQRVRVHLGTAEVLARITLPDGDLAPGGTALGQLRLEAPILARAGDRLVIRSYSPVHTIAGGVVLEPVPPRRRRMPDELRRALLGLRAPGGTLPALLTIAGPAGVDVADLPILTGLSPGGVRRALDGTGGLHVAADRLLDDARINACSEVILARLHRFHAEAPLEDGMDREALKRDVAGGAAAPLFEPALQRLTAAGDAVVHAGVAALATFRAAPGPRELEILHRLGEIHAEAGIRFPDLAELPPDLVRLPSLPLLLRHLERQGRLVRLGPTRWADAAAVLECIADLRTQLPPDTPLAVSDFKDVLNVTRKHLIPLLEYFDRVGVTARAGEARTIVTPTAGAQQQP
jgi:selenocysteine-specific elongation factor